MRIGETENGLLLLVENEHDRALLESIAADARPSAGPLAEFLGALVEDKDLAGDWREYVTPDLTDAFLADVDFVAQAITRAGSRGQIAIRAEDAMRWYSALNQARLALEEKHRFSETGAAGAPLARMRDRFYLWLQSAVFSLVTGN